MRHLAGGLADRSLWEPIDAAGAELAAMEAEARRLAHGYERIEPRRSSSSTPRQRRGPYDKTLLLLLGQERARMSAVVDGDSVTFAAGFDSGVNFLEAFGISGGMPTRVSIQRSQARGGARAGPRRASRAGREREAASSPRLKRLRGDPHRRLRSVP